jgi:hypothetical protein
VPQDAGLRVFLLGHHEGQYGLVMKFGCMKAVVFHHDDVRMKVRLEGRVRTP